MLLLLKVLGLAVTSVFSSSPPQAPCPSPGPMVCQESEYLDEHRKCTPCRNCMPGQELSKVNRLLWNDWESSSTEAFTVLGISSASLPSER